MKPIRQYCAVAAVIAGLCCLTCGTTVQTERRAEKVEPAGAAQVSEKSERAAPAPADRIPAGKARYERGEDRVAGDTSIAPVPSKKKSDDRPGVIDSERRIDGTERRVDAQAGSGLKAGFADDNRQFNYFVDFLEKYKDRARHIPIDIRERIILKVVDQKSLPLANAEVSIYDANILLFQGKTYSDGSFPFYPSHLGKNRSAYRAAVSYGGRTRELSVRRTGRRETRIVWDSPRPGISEVPLDIVFVMDTTGSMGEEIERLKRTIELIHLNLTSMTLRTRVRFGMVLYKDRRDEYLTRVIPLTDSLERFREQLADVEASGGGDHPEDLQAALEKTMKRIEWNTSGVRMAFIITDAPPHLDYGQQYTYVDAVMDARRKGVKVFSVGTGGLNLDGEYVLRQISQYTLGKYIFLTYGERGESEGGVEGSVSHHSVPTFRPTSWSRSSSASRGTRSTTSLAAKRLPARSTSRRSGSALSRRRKHCASSSAWPRTSFQIIPRSSSTRAPRRACFRLCLQARDSRSARSTFQNSLCCRPVKTAFSGWLSAGVFSRFCGSLSFRCQGL
jgi:Mg-chelatase subunit ChlD